MENSPGIYRDYSRYLERGGELVAHKKSTNNFPARLHRMLSDDQHSDVISWMVSAPHCLPHSPNFMFALQLYPHPNSHPPHFAAPWPILQNLRQREVHHGGGPTIHVVQQVRIVHKTVSSESCSLSTIFSIISLTFSIPPD